MSSEVEVRTDGAVIAFLCAVPAHLAPNGTPSDNLTIHEKKWAYCPRDVRAGGHEWQPIGGLPLSEVELTVRGMRRKNGGNGSNGNGKHGPAGNPVR